MNISRCVNGHFYDKDKYFLCPYCNMQNWENNEDSDGWVERKLAKSRLDQKEVRNLRAVPSEEKRSSVLLEGAIAVFNKAKEKDEMAIQLLLESLVSAPLYVPVQVNIQEIFENLDITYLTPGDILGDVVAPGWDVKIKIHTVKKGKWEIVPLFTSLSDMEKKEEMTGLRMHLHECLPQIMKMNRPIVINLFSEFCLMMEPSFIRKVLWPRVKEKNKEREVEKESKGKGGAEV